jgi:hypothetical protein
MQAESVLTLTAEAGWTMVAAIDTEAWDTSKHRFAPLLGRGNARQTRLAEHRLDETREELTQAADPELMAVALAERWAWRLADLIEERPGAEADLRALVEEIQAALPGQAVSVPHLVVAEGEMSVDVASRETSGTAVPRRHAFAARDEFPALMPVRHAALGSENAETLGARVSLASWIGEAGNPAAARDEFAALLPVCGRVLGPEHPETLITRHQLANLVGYAGDAAGARDHFAALLPVRERVSGPDHPGTRTAWLNFAYWTGSAGDEARPETNTRCCCAFTRRSWALNTLTPWPPAPASRTGPRTPEIRLGLVTNMRRCCPFANGFWVRSTPTPWPPGTGSLT